MVEKIDYRVINELPNNYKIMNNNFWIELCPGMKDEAIEYMIKDFINV